MKPFSVALSLASLLVASSAFAQGTPNQPPPLPPPNNPPPVAQPAPAQPAPAQPAPAQPAAGTNEQAAPEGGEERGHTGFQMALRTGVMIPMGDADKQSKMSDVFGPQVPLIVHLGAKVIPNLYIGGFLGFAFGGAGGKLADACEKGNVSCVSASFQIGAEIQYHILPAEKINPWIGYGIGFSSAAVNGSGNGRDVTASVAGVDFAHLMAGLDFRLSKVIGIGPLVDFTVGTYSRQKSEGFGGNVDQDIPDDQRATHMWLTIGGRLVIFP